MHNQTDSTNSAFKIPLAPQPKIPCETLLFNDIMEDKCIDLRNYMVEFLQVHPFRKFDHEFSKFLKHLKHMMFEGQRTGTNVSRLTNSFQMNSVNPRSSSSFNYRQPVTMSMMNASRPNSTFRLPETSFQPVETTNPFKPSGSVHLEPKVVLSRIEQSRYMSNKLPSLCATVVEVSIDNNATGSTNKDCEEIFLPEPVERPQSPARNGYSDVTMTENKSVSSSQNNRSTNNSAIDSLFKDAGFKITVGVPDDSNMNKNSNSSKHDNQLNIIKNVEKYLSMWSINVKINKSQLLKPTKVTAIITGTLLGEDRVTVLERHHDAGVMVGRKAGNLVKTNNGLYHLVGNIIGGSPNELYQACLSIHGIPRTWKSIIKQLSGLEKENKNKLLNFSLDSPAGPIKATKDAIDLNTSFTRKGTMYKKISLASQKTKGKRKISECNIAENSKNKQRKFDDALPPLLASTPKRPVRQSVFENPSQILKNKFHQSIHNKTKMKSNIRTQTTLNDSIHVTKKRQSNSKEQSSEFLKQNTPIKLLSNSIKHSEKTNNSPLDSVNSSKQLSVHNSNSINNSSSKLKNSTSDKSTSIINNLNNSKPQSLLKSSINSAKNSSSSSNKSKKKTAEKIITVQIEKATKQTKQKKHMTNVSSSEIANPNNRRKIVKQKTKTMNQLKGIKDKSEAIKTQKKRALCSSSAEYGLFGNEDNADYRDSSDFNIMASPGKLSVISRGNKSRSETPPLFSHQWSSTAKSLAVSEPPTPLSKSVEAKALKRVKAPKITLKDEIKNDKRKDNKKSADFKTVSNKINKMLEFGDDYIADED